MADLYLFDFGDDAERVRRAEEREAISRRLRDRYSRYLMTRAHLDEPTARRAIAVLFDPRDLAGEPCLCSCHPRLSQQHGDGLDCRCTWDQARRAEEAARWEDLRESEFAIEMRAGYEREEREIAAWLAGQTGVEATRTTTAAPEQWEGVVDGHSFYFRERHGEWRIELDLADSGYFAQRLVRVEDNGELITEPVPILEGEVIARGVDSQLGETVTDHLAFIVTAIRDHLWRARCDHAGASSYCPKCGFRIRCPS